MLTREWLGCGRDVLIVWLSVSNVSANSFFGFYLYWNLPCDTFHTLVEPKVLHNRWHKWKYCECGKITFKFDAVTVSRMPVQIGMPWSIHYVCCVWNACSSGLTSRLRFQFVACPAMISSRGPINKTPGFVVKSDIHKLAIILGSIIKLFLFNLINMQTT